MRNTFEHCCLIPFDRLVCRALCLFISTAGKNARVACLFCPTIIDKKLRTSIVLWIYSLCDLADDIEIANQVYCLLCRSNAYFRSPVYQLHDPQRI